MARSKTTLSDEQRSALEAHLAGTLKRVTPPMEVARRLRERMIRFPEPKVIVSRFRDWRRMFFVLGSVLSGLLAIITIGRALYYFFGRRRFEHENL